MTLRCKDRVRSFVVLGVCAMAALVMLAATAVPAAAEIQFQDPVTAAVTTDETGTIEVIKDLNPASDPGRFNLRIDGSAPNLGSRNVGDGGTTGERVVATGLHTVDETAGTGTSLTRYQKSITCRDQDGTGEVVAQTTGDDGGPLTVDVTTGADIVCVITNTRETARLEVRTALEPATDGGRFNLQIDGQGDPDAIDVGDGGSTGEQVVVTGTHTVGETAGSGTDLGDYQKSITCRSNNGTGLIVAQTTGDDAGPLSVSLIHNQDVVCVITNERETGTIEVINQLVPDDDPGRFDLLVDGTTIAADAGHDGTTGPVTVNTGSGHSVAETAGTNTSLDYYRSTIACARNGSPAYSASGPNLGSIAIGKDDQLVCTITNDRPTGQPRGIGHWSAWNRCTNGNQSATADRSGGTANGYFLVEDVLPQVVGDFGVTTCAQAVRALKKDDQSGGKQSSDAAYGVAAHLLAAKSNYAAGGKRCPASAKAINDAQALLDRIGFSGSGSYLPSGSTSPDRATASNLADTLDRYNNGTLCS